MKRYRIVFVMTGFLLCAVIYGMPSDTLRKKKNHFYFDLTTGYSLPTGKFSSADTTDDKSGFAAGGFYIQFTGTWRGDGSVGLGFSYTFQQNNLQKGYETIRQNVYQIPLGTRAWTNHYVLAGPSFHKDIKRFFIEVKVLGGVVLAYNNSFGMLIPVDTIPKNAVESTGPGTGFAYQILCGAGYTVTRNLGIHLNLSFLGGAPRRTKTYNYYRYEYDPEYQQYIPVYMGGEYQVKKTISTILMGIGIVYSL